MREREHAVGEVLTSTAGALWKHLWRTREIAEAKVKKQAAEILRLRDKVEKLTERLARAKRGL
jgi:ubiquinone biosynthesis protein UbiJ